MRIRVKPSSFRPTKAQLEEVLADYMAKVAAKDAKIAELEAQVEHWRAQWAECYDDLMREYERDA